MRCPRCGGTNVAVVGDNNGEWYECLDCGRQWDFVAFDEV